MSGGLQSSAYEVPVVAANLPIAVNANIFTTDINVTKDLLNGDSGLFRILFSLETAGALDTAITVTKIGGGDYTSPLKLNADNTFIILSDGYYRFDVSVAPGDQINISSAVQIDKVNDLQVQRIPIAT